MAKKIQAVRGMNDILPDQTPIWQAVESAFRQLLRSYDYHEIRMPLVEVTELFKRSIGEVTDIVEKEMYNFDDRNGENLCLRPEGTASCVRACEEHGLLYNQTQRLWYTGPMFRYEKPQKGRYRQFHQIGVETFGMLGPDIDAEVIQMSAKFWQALGVESAVSLELNSIGSLAARQVYKTALVDYLNTVENDLDEDSKRRLGTNPLRILDSKNTTTQKLLENAPKLVDFLDDDSRQHFAQLQLILTELGIEFKVNPNLVRGLDYYNATVFEWVTTQLGAQGTVCAGGRYDALVGHLGGKDTPAVGFAIGIERLILLLETMGLTADFHPSVDCFIAAVGDGVAAAGLQLADQIRSELSNVVVRSNLGGGSFKKQLKKADKSGAEIALILGEQEIKEQMVGLKYLRQDKPQQSVPLSSIMDVLTEVLKTH